MNLKFSSLLWVASYTLAQQPNQQGFYRSFSHHYRNSQRNVMGPYYQQGSRHSYHGYSPDHQKVHSYQNRRYYPLHSSSQQYMPSIQLSNSGRPTSSYTSSQYNLNTRRMSNNHVHGTSTSGSIQAYPSSVQGSTNRVYSAPYTAGYTTSISGGTIPQISNIQSTYSRTYTPVTGTNTKSYTPSFTSSNTPVTGTITKTYTPSFSSSNTPVTGTITKTYTPSFSSSNTELPTPVQSAVPFTSSISSTSNVGKDDTITLSQEDLNAFTFGEFPTQTNNRRQRSRLTSPIVAFPAVPDQPQENQTKPTDKAQSDVISQGSISQEKVKPAWQGKIQGFPVTKCHNGELLRFRQRCDKKIDCLSGEDEVDCDWYKVSTIESISTPEELDQLMESQSPVVLEFFAPWCPACITFLPHLESIKNNLQSLNVTMRKVNTDEAPILKERFNVDTYPRVVVWRGRDEEPRTYDKSLGMTSEKITPWILEQLNQD